MRRMGFTFVLALAAVAVPLLCTAQQLYRLPDKNQLKHLTTKQVSRPPDFPGETDNS